MGAAKIFWWNVAHISIWEGMNLKIISLLVQ